MVAIADPVVLIASSADRNRDYGSGFIVRRVGEFACIVTCAHVIRDVGAETICVNGLPGTVVVTGDDLGLDLAVIKVEGLVEDDETLFAMGEPGPIGSKVVVEGYQAFVSSAQNHRTQKLPGTLAEPFQITAHPPNNPIQAWELKFEDDSVRGGFSGAPVVNPQTGKVFAVVSHALRDGVGAAIAIEELNRIWQPVDRNQLKEALMQLGYRPQAKLFRKLVQKKPIGAYLIHGPTERYGQQWLVNRLLQQYVPTSMSGKKLRVSLDRVGRRSDVRGLWAELAMELKCDRNTKPKEIAKRALRWWKTQDLILAIYDVDCLSEELLNKLIQEFWLPLANEAEGMRTKQGNEHKLLMFLIDNEAVTAQRNIPFTEKLDADTTNYYPYKSPQNKEFSEEELDQWIGGQFHHLPAEMTRDTDATIGEMYELSDEGVPEWVFFEICKRCGYDWRMESSSWYSI